MWELTTFSGEPMNDLGWVAHQDDQISVIGNIHQHPELMEAIDQ